MFVDDEMLKTILKSYNCTDEYIANFNEEIKNLFFELVIAHTFNFYASQNSQKEIDELETLMHKVSKYGKYEDQYKVTELIKNTILSYPELTEQIMQLQKELQKQLIMNFLKYSKEDAQIEIFSYLIQMKNLIAKRRDNLTK